MDIGQYRTCTAIAGHKLSDKKNVVINVDSKADYEFCLLIYPPALDSLFSGNYYWLGT